MTVSETVFNAELQYQTAISIAKNLHSQGLLTEEEYAIIDTKMLQKYQPLLGTLFAAQPLT